MKSRFLSWALPFALATTALVGLPATAYAQTTLTILMIEGYDTDAMKALAEAYSAAHPDVTVDVQALPWSQFFQVAELRLRSGDESVDLIYTDAPLVASYAANGYIKPFSAETSAQADQELVPAAITGGTYNGQLYALPMNSSAQLLYYNIDLLKQAGVTPPAGLTRDSTASAADIAALAEGRWTFEQIAEAAASVSGTEGGTTKPWGFAFEQFSELYALQPLGGSLGAGVISDDTMTAAGVLDGPEWTKAATWWSDLFNTLEASPRELGFGEAPQMFINDQLAMFVGGTWNIPALAASDVNFGIAPYPYFAGGTATTPTGSWFLGVAAASPDADVATDFAQYATLSEAGTKNWFANLNQLPATKALLDSIASDRAFDTFPASAMRLSGHESQTTAVPRPVTVAYSQLQDAFRTAFTDIANGVAVEEALATAVAAYDDAAARLNRP